MRKTIEIAKLKAKINMLVASSDNEEVRRALTSLLSNVLHDTGNYAGFNYVDWLEGGSERWRADGSSDNISKYLGPEYKRFYF